MHGIVVSHFSKTYRTRLMASGVWGSVRGLFRPCHRSVEAVRDISFSVKPGERVAFIGPNGAGKSTTIKALTGILYPSAGQIEVAGIVPWEDRKRLAYQIGCVFGQRSQLWYHLAARDTYELLARIYDLDLEQFRMRRDELIALFELQELVVKPVRQLSLGERMRCELVASLLHQPRILFLDEPTIGLDVAAKALIRDLVLRISEREGATVLLTSHDTGDIEGVCDRVVVINAGRIILDQGIDELRRSYITRKLVRVQTEKERCDLALPGITVVKREPYALTIEVDLALSSIEAVVSECLKQGALHDLTVEDPPLEEIIKQIYAEACALQPEEAYG